MLLNREIKVSFRTIPSENRHHNRSRSIPVDWSRQGYNPYFQPYQMMPYYAFPPYENVYDNFGMYYGPQPAFYNASDFGNKEGEE